MDYAKLMGLNGDDERNSGGMADIDKLVYLKKPRCIIKLAPEVPMLEGATEDYVQQVLQSVFQPVTDYYQGKPVTGYVVRCVLLDGFDDNNNSSAVRFLKLPTSAILGIVSELNDGEDLLSANGPAVKVKKGDGNTKTYSVSTSTQRFKGTVTAEPSRELADVARDYTEWKRKQNGMDEPTPQSTEETSFSFDDDDDVPF